MITVPLSGEQYEIAAGSVRATVVAAGGGLRELYDGDRALVVGYGADEPVKPAIMRPNAPNPYAAR